MVNVPRLPTVQQRQAREQVYTGGWKKVSGEGGQLHYERLTHVGPEVAGYIERNHGCRAVPTDGGRTRIIATPDRFEHIQSVVSTALDT